LRLIAQFASTTSLMIIIQLSTALGNRTNVMIMNSCDISFHQYCYGIFELPTSDFYCDICVHTNTKKKTASSKNRRHIPKGKINEFTISSEKPAERKVPNDIFCRVCLQNDFPLKRMKKNEWYHITCLMFHDISKRFIIISNTSLPQRRRVSNKAREKSYVN
jgi:PHD-finger